MQITEQMVQAGKEIEAEGRRIIANGLACDIEKRRLACFVMVEGLRREGFQPEKIGGERCFEAVRTVASRRGDGKFIISEVIDELGLSWPTGPSVFEDGSFACARPGEIQKDEDGVEVSEEPRG